MKLQKGIKIILCAAVISAGAVLISSCQSDREMEQTEIYADNGAEIGKLYYTNTLNDVTVTGFEYGEIALEIPSEIDGMAVIGIGNNAFASDEILSKIILPETVKKIDAKAFFSCQKLTEIYTRGNPEQIETDSTAFESSMVQSIEGDYADDDNTYFCSGKFTYSDKNKEEDGGIVITGFKAAIAIDIPQEINGYPIIEIGENAFLNNKYLQSVVIPESVTIIADHAFYNCSSLQNVTANGSQEQHNTSELNNLIKIGEWAFSGCKSLGSVKFSDNLTTIEKGAFSRCTSLTEIEIPASVETVGSSAFDDCTAIKSITVAEGNPVYCDIDGVLFNKSQTEILKYPEGRGGEYTIPSSVTTVGEYALKNCTATLTVPDTVTAIKYGGFSSTNSTGHLNLPDSIVYAEGAVCTGRTSVYFAGKTYNGNDFNLHRSMNSFPFARQ